MCARFVCAFPRKLSLIAHRMQKDWHVLQSQAHDMCVERRATLVRLALERLASLREGAERFLELRVR
jgi:hypothetical protein